VDNSSIIALIDQHPIAGSIFLVLAVIVQQYLKNRHGENDVSKIESETNKLARQTSEVVNRCSEKTAKVMDSNIALLDAIDKHLEANDVRQIRADVKQAVQMLAKMDGRESASFATLDRVSTLLRSVADDLQKTDARIVHEHIIAEINSVQKTVEDIKRIAITIASSK
jgi:ABC-type transporter Mla subunit MlaD